MIPLPSFFLFLVTHFFVKWVWIDEGEKMSKSNGKNGKNMKPVTMDILSAIYQSTLQVGSGYTPDEVELKRQMEMAYKIVGKHGVTDTLVGFFYAYLTLAKSEVMLGDVRSGRIFVLVGNEQFALRPYIRGLDAYMYARWGDHMEDAKMRVCNSMLISPKWGIDFLNFPYDPDKSYKLDIEAKDVGVDLSGIPGDN